MRGGQGQGTQADAGEGVTSRCRRGTQADAGKGVTSRCRRGGHRMSGDRGDTTEGGQRTRGQGKKCQRAEPVVASRATFPLKKLDLVLSLAEV